MSALSDYINEARRQRDLLEYADSRDSWAIDFLMGRGSGFGPRRVWTRQDKTRLTILKQNWEFQRASKKALAAGRKLWDLGVSFPTEVAGRHDTRLSRVLRRCDIRPFHGRALAEAAANSTYGLVAPLVLEATAAHEHLLECFQCHMNDERIEGEWNDVERRHDDALEALGGHVLVDTSPQPKSQSDDPSPALGMLSSAALASKHSVNHEQLRGRLGRWRKYRDAGFVEVENRKPQDPQFLYDESAVLPVIKDLQNNAKNAHGKRTARKT